MVGATFPRFSPIHRQMQVPGRAALTCWSRTATDCQPTKNWSLNGGADFRYVALRSPALNQGNSGLVWNVNLNSS